MYYRAYLFVYILLNIFSRAPSCARDNYVHVQMAKCKNKVEEQRRQTESSVRRTCEAVGNELNRQIQVRILWIFLSICSVYVCASGHKLVVGLPVL